MPHSKISTDNYQNLGGVNVKASPYITGPLEFLDLRNFDFQTPGSLSQRWGSTQYIGLAFPAQSTGFYEYEKLSGFSQIINTGSSFAWNIDGTSYQVLRSSYQIGYSSNLGSSTVFLQNGVLQNSNYSFVTFVDQMFAANGRQFWRYDGATTYIYSLPMPFTFNNNVFVDLQPGGTGVGATAGGMSGIYTYWLGYLNNRGYLGPSSASFFQAGGLNNWAIGYGTANAEGATQISIQLETKDKTYLYGHGITAFAIYRTVGVAPSTANGLSAFFGYLQNNPRGLIGYLPIDGVGYTNTFIDRNNSIIQSGGNESFDNNNIQHFAIQYRDTTGASNVIVGETMVPKYLEIYNNQLFMAGYSNLLSNIFWSNIGEPEAVAPESFAEVRTNDGDRIVGLKSYLSRLYIFKLKSVHVLSGQDPENFQLNEVTDQYGCVSHRAIAIYNDTMLFLDRKGVMRFNGASLDNISDKIEPFLNRMNYTAAIENATAIHDKQRNQVMFGIPIDGSTVNNFTLVYDYLVNGWTFYEGYNPDQFVVAQGRLDNNTVMFSDYSGLIHNFGATFPSDNGRGFTTLAKSRFLHDLGESVEKQWRRLFVNVDPIVGTTVTLNINFFKNFGTTVQINRTLYANPFQSRTDFGISGKSLAFELSKYDDSTIFKFHGFAVTYRFQRAV